MSQKVDVVGQYISQLLLPRLNSADELYMNCNYKEAIFKQQGVIRTLQRISEDDVKELKAWEKDISDIFEESKKIDGITGDAKTDEREKYLAKKFARKYKELDWKIWGKLHEFGYFSSRKNYGLSRVEIDKIPDMRVE